MHDRHHAHAHQPQGDDGPTLLFQRNLPGQGERCTICPFNQPAATNRAAGTPPPRPVLPAIGQSHHPATTHPSIDSPYRPATSPRRSNPTRVAPTNAPPATLPRPALLAADLRGSGTLVLPDALRSAGPDAATIEQPQGPGPHPFAPRRDAPGHPPNGRAARDPDFDELASPDITVLQPALAPTIQPIHPVRPRRRTSVVSTRVYLALNVCLGLLIVAGLVVLAVRDHPSAAPGVSASE